MGNHRKNKRSHTKRFVTIAAGAGVLTIGGAIVNTGVASAHDWSQVAMCESSGDWNINTGNGFYGGLQFTQSTWDAYKPAGAPARADLASTADQVAAAEATLSAQGIGAWPVCGAYLGWGGTTPDSTSPTPSTVASAAAEPGTAGNTVTVSEGDTLFNLAAAKGIRWQDVWVMNAWIADPDQIRVGDVIRF
ncbi:transglycosylase family protein [Rhodococcus erythropolis]|uniref:LysM peptidoglycan-binding domain-containing protein n=1 Tax=Rhodococcus erythropolis TaxID=1833 RepID=UPI0024B92DFB|nr:transglycosylase family protein [Rhodococcus erythropolis]MDJ0402740.1 transglycosylase family protein [Rhodococcus erythropolis]